MGIGNVGEMSMDMAQAATMNKIGIAVMDKALDTTKQLAAGEINMMNDLPKSAGYGDRLNVTA
ncbi:MAG: YjfB family protein [Ruminococcus sp.]|jgi:D-arabinose 1-dehydrogenase-like Zn-dependent alcohol dehydrogenase|nr:YjfB family protein [Ruminococcus sp.]